jgi:DNA mismatch repair protein MutL
LHNSYIVTQDEKGVVIIDQHALHERILYNRYRRRLTEGGLTSQRMLIPASLTLSAGEAALLEEAGDMLGTLGIVVESFGPDSVAVQQFPTVLAERGVDCEAFLRDVLDQLARDDLADREVLIEKVLAVMACKAAVKAGDPLDEREMRNLLADGRQAEKASSCPHGRPTTIRLTLGELEKQFKRT